jgi:hypothetical protein
MPRFLYTSNYVKLYNIALIVAFEIFFLRDKVYSNIIFLNLSVNNKKHFSFMSGENFFLREASIVFAH